MAGGSSLKKLRKDIAAAGYSIIHLVPVARRNLYGHIAPVGGILVAGPDEIVVVSGSEEKEMFEELKKKIMKSSLLWSVILIIAGLGLAGWNAMNAFYAATGYADFTQLAPDRIKSSF